MKKAKRILSLVLAVMLVMSILAIPAFAAGESRYCPDCRQKTYICRSENRIEQYSYSVMDGSCPFVDGAHPHFKVEVTHNCSCVCGARGTVVEIDDVCISE